MAPSQASPRTRIAPAKPALERWRFFGARLAVAVLAWLVFQASGGTTPGGRITPGGRPTPGGRVLDQLENAVKAPLPETVVLLIVVVPAMVMLPSATNDVPVVAPVIVREPLHVRVELPVSLSVAPAPLRMKLVLRV